MPRFLRPHHCLRLPEAEIGELLNDALLKRHRRGPKGGQIAAFPKEMIVAIAGITLGGIGSAPRLDSWRADAVVVACGEVIEAGCCRCGLNEGCACAGPECPRPSLDSTDRRNTPSISVRALTRDVLSRGYSLDQRIDRRLHGGGRVVAALVGDDEYAKVVLRHDVDVAL